MVFLPSLRRFLTMWKSLPRSFPWISVDWKICEDKEPEEVLLYRLDLTDLSLNLHNSSENKFCPDRECSRNMTLLMPCLDYSVSITLVTNDENSTV